MFALEVIYLDGSVVWLGNFSDAVQRGAAFLRNTATAVAYRIR